MPMLTSLYRGVCLVLCLLVASACASSESVRGGFDPDEFATAYETRSIPLRMNRTNAMGLQGKKLVTLRAVAACPGQDCIPQEVLLVFANDGENETLLNYETLTLTADGEEYVWDKLLDRQEAARVPPGDFLRLPLDREDFEQIAHADVVTGTLGGAPFQLAPDRRQPFRDLLERLRTEP